MSPTPKQMGRRLAKLRKTRGLTQYALAKEANVSREYVRKLEAGQSDPTVGMLTKLARALGVRVEDLLP
jgi:transcriptional regulator with XRE-family HTH domain